VSWSRSCGRRVTVIGLYNANKNKNTIHFLEIFFYPSVLLDTDITEYKILETDHTPYFVKRHNTRNK